MMAKQKKILLSSADINSLQSLMPGSVVDLQISTPTAPKRVKTGYIGADVPNCLLFQVPSESRWGYLRDVLVPDNEVVLRYVLEGDEGKVIAFRSHVIKVITHPVPILFVAMPESLQTLALRKHKRWTPGIQARVSASDDKQTLSTDCMIVDVSLQGCRCVLESSPEFPILEKGKTIVLNEHLLQRPKLLKVVFFHTMGTLYEVATTDNPGHAIMGEHWVNDSKHEWIAEEVLKRPYWRTRYFKKLAVKHGTSI